MENCEALSEGEAHRIFLSKEIAEQITKITGEDYHERDELVICWRKQCPYHNQGRSIFYTECEELIANICKSKGLINKLESTN